MTNYIEEMMKTADCKKQIMCEWTCKDAEKCNASCEHFETKQDVYPPFTAEKQLEVIKLITQNGTLSTLQIEYYIKEKDYKLSTYQKVSNYNQDFTQALAQLTTELMNAGELDKEKVKGILEGC